MRSNCQAVAWWRHLLDGRDTPIVLMMTDKNEWSWRLSRFWHLVIGWLVICPALYVINIAVFALRGRWQHALTVEPDGRLSEFVPDDEHYSRRRFPPPLFEGSVRDSGYRMVRDDVQ